MGWAGFMHLGKMQVFGLVWHFARFFFLPIFCPIAFIKPRLRVVYLSHYILILYFLFIFKSSFKHWPCKTGNNMGTPRVMTLTKVNWSQELSNLESSRGKEIGGVETLWLTERNNQTFLVCCAQATSAAVNRDWLRDLRRLQMKNCWFA